MRDRTAEFKAQLPVIEIDPNITTEDESTDELSEDLLADFYTEVGEIKYGLSLLQGYITNFDQNKHSEALILINTLRDRLKTMKGEIQNDQSAKARIQVNIQRSLVQKFVPLVGDYKQLQSDHADLLKTNLQRQSALVGSERSSSNQLFVQSILEDKRDHSEVSQAIVNLKEQHRDIMILEQHILELHQIFIDISTLIEAQDTIVDSIEYQTSQATIWTGKATNDIKDADKYVKKSRTRCCCCGGVICAACAAGAGYVALTLAPLVACTIQ
jgi:t-SNARE complex subunit (syntaxin)